MRRPLTIRKALTVALVCAGAATGSASVASAATGPVHAPASRAGAAPVRHVTKPAAKPAAKIARLRIVVSSAGDSKDGPREQIVTVVTFRGAPVGGRSVVFEARPVGKTSWSVIGRETSSASGRAGLTVVQTGGREQYRVVLPAGAGFARVVSLTATIRRG
jgi:hypothetical protein